MQYDPAKALDVNAWLELDEDEKQDSVLRYHKRAKIQVGSLSLHAVIHVTVENQITEGLKNVQRALERLLNEGLDRHEAIHAIGSLVADHIFCALNGRKFDEKKYYRELAELSAESWRDSEFGRESSIR
jgi:hypothetical protein